MSTAQVAPSSNITESVGRASWMKRHPLLAFFVLAYALTWIPIAFVLIAAQAGWLASDSPVIGLVSQLISFGPAVAALILTAALEHRAGVGRLLRRLVQWRVGLQWYLVVFLGVPVAVVLGATLLFGGAPLRASADQWQTILVRFLPFVLIMAITTGLGEETGWRGFALPRLQGQYGPVAGTLALGVVWALWHLPNVIFFHWTPLVLGLFVVETIIDGFILTWVFNNTRGSLLLAMLLHGAQNTASHVVTTLVPSLTEGQVYTLYILTFGVCVLFIVAFTRGRLGYSPATHDIRPDSV